MPMILITSLPVQMSSQKKPLLPCRGTSQSQTTEDNPIFSTESVQLLRGKLPLKFKLY